MTATDRCDNCTHPAHVPGWCPTRVHGDPCSCYASSATETQDGERAHRPVDQPVKSRWPHRPHEPICEECGHAWRASCHDWITAEYASTPDDRDREEFAQAAEPIVRWYMEHVADPEVVAKWAGLRASGGTE